MSLRRLALAAITALFASPVLANDCLVTFDVETGADHGTLPLGTLLRGTIRYAEGQSMKLGSETVSYLSTGTMEIVAPDGTGLTGLLRAIHMVRTPHFADYASFDLKDVAGDLGAISSYEDPMLVTLYAPGGSLQSFDLPRDADGWSAFGQRREFQVHTPDTMWTLPGLISNFDGSCK
ncbi:MAG: hypothetical protein AAF367_00895 [Pseudomonadota bacterium]